MLRLTVKREFLANLMSFRFGAGLILCVVLTALTMPIMIEDYEFRLEEYNTAVLEHAGELNGIGTYSFLKPKIDRPPSVLGIFNEGVERQLAGTVLISSGNVPVAMPSAGQSDSAPVIGRDNELLAALPSLDMITIIKVVMGLLALLFAFDAVAGEREQGTLRLSLANSVPRDTLLFGKFVGGVFGLTLPLAVTFLLMVILMLLSPLITLSGSDAVRLCLLFLGSVLYVAVFYLLGLLISSLVRSARISLLLCLFAWTFLVVVMPDLSASIAREMIPVPTDEEREIETKQAEIEYYRQMSEFNVQYEPKRYMYSNASQSNRINTMVRFEYTYPERMMYHARRVEFAEPLRRSFAERIARIRENQASRLAKQVRWSRGIGMASPAAAYDVVTEALCGTDWEAYERFIDDARRYRLQVLDYIRDKGGLSFRFFTNVGLTRYLEMSSPEDAKTLDNPEYAPLRAFLTEMDTAEKTLDPDDFPVYGYRSERPGAVLSRVALYIAFIVLYGIILFSLSYIAFMRYDPR